MSDENIESSDNIIISEVQLILAEKRTSMAAMRTGIAVFALPLSVLSILVATSKYYDFIQVMHLMIPLLVICAVLIFLGSYLIIKSVTRLHKYDKLIYDIKRRHSMISEFLD